MGMPDSKYQKNAIQYGIKRGNGKMGGGYEVVRLIF